MRLLDRYVTGLFLRIFVLFVLGAPLLFVIFDLTDNVDKYVERGITWPDIALSYVYLFPQFVLWAMPIASLIATVFTVHGMARHSETAAAKAGGISFWRLYAPLPLLGALLTVAGLGLSELVPITTTLKAEILGERQAVRGSRTNFVFQGDQGRMLVINRLDADNGRVFQPRVEQAGDGLVAPTIHAVAETGTFLPLQGGWVFEDGHIRMLFEDAQRTVAFERMRTRGLDQSPEELLARPKEPDEMRYRELERFIGVIERAGARALKLRVDLNQKLALPVATLVVVLLGAPLAVGSHRGGAAFGIGVSLALTIVYLLLFRLTGALGAGGTISPLLAAWIPNLAFLVAGLVMLTRVRT